MTDKAAHTLVWLRNDLRIADNPALHAALDTGGQVTALYLHETGNGLRETGAAARWWLENSLASLENGLAALDIPLRVESGNAHTLVEQVVTETEAGAVFWNRRYGPAERDIDAAIKAGLKERGVNAASCPGNLLVEPWNIQTGSGGPYQVFTPFAKALRQHGVEKPVETGKRKGQTHSSPARRTIRKRDYEPPHWTTRMAQVWEIGEEAAQARLALFLDEIVETYAQDRDRPDREGTSRLSPHLRFGEISARQAWHAALFLMDAHPQAHTGAEKFLSELIWRDFSYHQLYHRPDISRHDMRDTLKALDWARKGAAFEAWAKGMTGVPIIDAGMRQLWATGWMHNRVRMLTASFLTKNMLVDWRQGEQWFWDTLVDADIASNPASWQWVAGCGMDAAPYFRIFNPVLQGEKFDPDGRYVRAWVPELAALPDTWLHKPFLAPDSVLAKAGMTPGKTYPNPVADLKAAGFRAAMGINPR